MGGLDPDAAETAGMAHDLGHPPFGHIAEDELDMAVKRIDINDGYEGNAQSFRLATKLIVGDSIYTGYDEIGPGLNLTRATLNGILKYPWTINGNPAKPKKWGAYETERDVYNWVRKDFDSAFGKNTKSLEAEVMDWADDITYAVHDVVDFYCADKIPLEIFKTGPSASKKAFLDEVFNRVGNENLKQNRKALESSFEYLCTHFFGAIESRFVGSWQQRKDIWQMMTLLITNYVNSISVAKTQDTGSLVEIGINAKNQIAMLKQLTWHYVILNNNLATVQYGQRKVVRTVFEHFYAATTEQIDTKILPRYYEEQVRSASDAERIRLAADCVSGMTEAEVSKIYKQLTGYKVGPIF